MLWNKIESSLCSQTCLVLFYLVNFGQFGSTATVSVSATRNQLWSNGRDGRDDDDDKRDDDDDSDVELWKIIGISGGIVGLAIILLIIYVGFYVRRRRKNKENGRKGHGTHEAETGGTTTNQKNGGTDQQRRRVTAPEINIIPPTSPPASTMSLSVPQESAPPFNPHFVNYESTIIEEDELPPPYNFAELSAKPVENPGQFQTTDGEKPKKKVHMTTEL